MDFYVAQNMKNAIAITAIFLVTICFISCQKEANGDLSVTELLTSHKWYWFRIGMTSNDSTAAWNLTFSRPCEKDNFFEFKPNKLLYIP